VTSPAQTLYTTVARAVTWMPSRAGYGARLVSDIEALDLVEPHADVVKQNSPGGGLRARLFAHTLERFRERMLALGASRTSLSAPTSSSRSAGRTS